MFICISYVFLEFGRIISLNIELTGNIFLFYHFIYNFTAFWKWKDSCMVPDERTNVNLNRNILFVMSLFLLVLSLFSFCMWLLMVWLKCITVWISFSLIFLNFMELLQKYRFISFMKCGSLQSLFLYLYFPHSSPFENPLRHILIYLMVSHMSLRLCTFYLFFFSLFSCCVISVMYLSSMIIFPPAQNCCWTPLVKFWFQLVKFLVPEFLLFFLMVSLS